MSDRPFTGGLVSRGKVFGEAPTENSHGVHSAPTSTEDSIRYYLFQRLIRTKEFDVISSS